MRFLQVRDVPDELIRDAKMEATWRGESLRAVVIRALQAEVERLRSERERAEGER